MLNRRQTLIGGAALTGLGALHRITGAAAQALPGTASIVSGFPPGGMGDILSRPLSERLRGTYAANVLVESKVGAGGRIAAEYVKRAAPDGLTILRIPGSIMTVYPHVYKTLNYDPLTDFIPVSTMVTYEFSFTAGPGLPAGIRTVADYVTWARANPNLASYGVPAAGSGPHFAGMMLQRATGMEFTSVAYRGGAPLLQDVLSGGVPVSFNVLGEVMSHVQGGRLRSLAVTGPQRSAFLPNVPTMGEQGYRDIVLQEWLGWFLPARTPVDTVRKLNQLIRDGLESREMVERIRAGGLEPRYTTPEEFARILKEDHTRWGPIVAATGFSASD